MSAAISAPLMCDNPVLASKPWSWRTSPKHSMHWWPLGAANYGDGASIEELHRLLVALRVLRHRGHRGLRGGGGVGGRRGQDGGGVDRHALPGPTGGGQAPGAPRPGAAPPARVCAEAWRDGRHRGRRGPGHRLGPAAPHRGLHGPRRGHARRPGQRAWASRTSTGPWPIGSSWPTPTGPRPPTRSARPLATSSWSELHGHVAGPDDPRPDRGLHRRRTSSTASSTTSSRPTAPRPKSAWGARRGSTSWPAPRRQRRADALVEMATRSRTAPAEGIRPAPLFSVFVGYETLHGRICELENGTVLAPSALSPWMDSAYFERAIFSLGNRVDVSVRARLFTGGTRRAIELRDRICTHPLLLRARRELPGRPHRDLRRGRPHHPGERPAALRLPQPPAQPTRAPRRPAPAAQRRLRGGRRRPNDVSARPGHHPPLDRAGAVEKAAPRHFGAPANRCACAPDPVQSVCAGHESRHLRLVGWRRDVLCERSCARGGRCKW